jgi:hypothetical protein
MFAWFINNFYLLLDMKIPLRLEAVYLYTYSISQVVWILLESFKIFQKNFCFYSYAFSTRALWLPSWVVPMGLSTGGWPSNTLSTNSKLRLASRINRLYISKYVDIISLLQFLAIGAPLNPPMFAKLHQLSSFRLNVFHTKHGIEISFIYRSY